MQIRRLGLAASTSVLLLAPAAHAESNTTSTTRTAIVRSAGGATIPSFLPTPAGPVGPGDSRRGEWTEGATIRQTPLELPIPTNGMGIDVQTFVPLEVRQ